MLRSVLFRTARCETAAALLVVLLATGCGNGVGTVYPVSGRITIDGVPLASKNSVVMFVPDRAKGNTTSYEPGATVDASGQYTLYTMTRKGAPPGWYKVVVTGTTEAPPPSSKGPLTQRPAPKSLVPARYGQATTTTLEVEVVASPAAEAYDLNLKP
jgi:hypothetical protein